MSLFIPAVEQLEKLVPELLRIRYLQIKLMQNLNDKQTESCIDLLITAVRRWFILCSLYNEESDSYCKFPAVSFKCADWQKEILVKHHKT
jgi:hypothetical protein